MKLALISDTAVSYLIFISKGTTPTPSSFLSKHFIFRQVFGFLGFWFFFFFSMLDHI